MGRLTALLLMTCLFYLSSGTFFRIPLERRQSTLIKGNRASEEGDEGSEKTQESGELEETKESGGSEKKTESGESKEKTESGESTEKTESGESKEKTESGESKEKTESEELEETKESGELEETKESGESKEKTESGELEETKESGESKEKTESGELEETKESGDSKEKTESGESKEKTESGELEETTESGELEETKESGELEETKESGELEETKESGESKEKTESGESEEKTESGESKEKTESGELDETTESGESEEKTESGELEETKESGESKEKTESGESVETMGSGELSESMEDDQSPEKVENDEVLETGEIRRTNQTGKIIFKNLRNEEYWGSITVGNPPQRFEVMFDTGSEVTWVPNWNCRNCYNKNTFNERMSRSYVSLNRNISIDYAIGHMRGICGKDVVNIAGYSVYNQEIATAMEATFKDNLFDGIVGLALGHHYSNQHNTLTPILVNFLSQKLLNRNILSFYMNRRGDPKDGGELVIGGWNPELFYPHKIQYIKTGSRWDLSIESIYFGQNKVSGMYFKAIPDTGHTLVTGPKNQIMPHINRMNAEELENGLYFVKCNRINQLPNFSIFINRQKYTIRGSDYIFTNSSHRGYCLLGLGRNDDSEWVLGTVFLANFYTIFDFQNARVAFAPLKRN